MTQIPVDSPTSSYTVTLHSLHTHYPLMELQEHALLSVFSVSVLEAQIIVKD